MDPLWAELINSDWHDHRGSGAREDRLDNDEWLRRFAERGGWQESRLPDAGEREALRRLRHLLRTMVDAARAGEGFASRHLQALNRILRAAPVVRTLEEGERGPVLQLEPASAGIDRLQGEVAAAFAHMLSEGEPERLKICANPDCGWVIYDRSRNRSRRWCEKTECGNLIKVRQHRARRRRTDTGRPRS